MGSAGSRDLGAQGPQGQPSAKAAAMTPPRDCRALGSVFPSIVRLLVAEPGRTPTGRTAEPQRRSE